MVYIILETRINFTEVTERVMINVAIESSPGRFKAYQMESGQSNISMEEIKNTAKYGVKLTKQIAESFFKNISLNYKYEG